MMEGIGKEPSANTSDTAGYDKSAQVKRRAERPGSGGDAVPRRKRRPAESTDDAAPRRKKRPAESADGTAPRRKKRPAESADETAPRRKKRPAESADGTAPRRKKRPAESADETVPRRKKRPSESADETAPRRKKRPAENADETAPRRKKRSAEGAEDTTPRRRKRPAERTDEIQKNKKSNDDSEAVIRGSADEGNSRPKYFETVNADGVRERRSTTYSFLPDEPPEPDQETLRKQREEEEQKELESGLLAEEELRMGEHSEEERRARRRAAKQRAARKRAAEQRKMQKIAIGAGALVILLLIGLLIFHRVSGGKKETGEERAQGSTQASQEETTGADSTVPADESTVAVITPEPVSESITLTFTGDCTFGRDQSFDYDTSFDAFYEENGYEYFFANVKNIFEQDDLTVVNFEGTLTNVDSSERVDKQYAFKADPSYVKILSTSGVDAANMANNHSEDYGEQSYTDTLQYLSEAGITTFGYSDSKVVDVKGVKVGLVGILELFEEKDCQYKMIEQIDAVKAQGAQIVVVTMHWGEEAQYYYDQDQYDLGRIAIDHGADLVIGHHPHRVQAIETYKGKNIVYSLGNFCFGGNYEPSDMDSFIYQQTFTVNGGELVEDNVTNLIPISISSASSYNNYQPTPYEDPDEIARIIAKIKDLTAEPGVPLTEWSSGQSANNNSETGSSGQSTEGSAETESQGQSTADYTETEYSENTEGEDGENYDGDYGDTDEEADYDDGDYADYDEEY